MTAKIVLTTAGAPGNPQITVRGTDKARRPFVQRIDVPPGHDAVNIMVYSTTPAVVELLPDRAAAEKRAAELNAAAWAKHCGPTLEGYFRFFSISTGFVLEVEQPDGSFAHFALQPVKVG
jgi:hypothetical protein